MKLKFLGTRGEIDLRTRLHRMHSSLEASYKGARVLIDCGADWTGRLHRMRPHAIVLTHAHPDHAWCRQERVPKALFTHCGSEIVRARPRTMSRLVRDSGRVQGVDASIAVDGMEVILP